MKLPKEMQSPEQSQDRDVVSIEPVLGQDHVELATPLVEPEPKKEPKKEVKKEVKKEIKKEIKKEPKVEKPVEKDWTEP